MEKDTWTGITDAVREKAGSTNAYVAGEVAPVIRALNTYEVESLMAVANGEYIPPAGVAYNSVTVDVSDSIIPRDLPDDGKTYIGYIVPEGTPDHIRTATICFSQTAANGVVLDWGDGSPPESFPSTGNQTATHDYAETGREYIISLRVAAGTVSFGGSNTRTVVGSTDYRNSAHNRARLKWCLFGDGVLAVGTRAFDYSLALQEVILSEGIRTVSSYAFNNCVSLRRVTLPNSITGTGANLFNNCYSLKAVSIPNSVSSMGASTFYGCWALEEVKLPEAMSELPQSSFHNCQCLTTLQLPNGLTSIGTQGFYVCTSLASMTIPPLVTSIGGAAFSTCYSLNRLRFEAQTPPSAATTTTFASLPTTCVISVPRGSLAAYTSATYYPDSNTYTYIEED